MGTSWTKDDLARIEHAIAQGAKSVEFDDRTVTYRSMAELFRARDAVRRALDLDDGVTPASKQKRITTQKGFH